MPFSPRTEWMPLSLATWLSGGCVLAVVYRIGRLDEETFLAVTAATLAVWAIALTGWFLRNDAGLSARDLAFSHLKGSGLRLLFTLGAAVFLVAGLRLEARSVAITLVAVYLSVLSVETLSVSRRLKRLDGAVTRP